MANKPLLATIAALIGIASLSGYLASAAFYDGMVANKDAVAKDHIAAEQTDVEPPVEEGQSSEPGYADEHTSSPDTNRQSAEEPKDTEDSGTRPATTEEETDISRIAKESGMVTTPHGNGFDVGPSSDDSHNNPTEARE